MFDIKYFNKIKKIENELDNFKKNRKIYYHERHLYKNLIEELPDFMKDDVRLMYSKFPTEFISLVNS